jgi:very-short-patch-repair endonuclease
MAHRWRAALDVAREWAGRQHGVVARRQLLGAGLSRADVDGLVGAGFLQGVHRGVYRAGPLAGTYAREMAAVLACGPGAVVGGLSTSELWRPLPWPAPNDVEIITPQRSRGARPGIRVHRVRSLHSADVTIAHGVPVTTPARTLLDLASRISASELERGFARAERAGIVTRNDLLAILRKYPRRPGTPALAALLAATETLAFTRSEAEDRFLTLVREAELPAPRVNHRVRGFEVDFLWADARLIVEIDGFAFHASAAAFEYDRRRDAILTAAGYRVVRITWNELTRKPMPIASRVAQALVVQ